MLNAGPFVPGQALIDMPEPVPAGAYPAQMLQDLATAGVHVREEPSQTVRGIRGTAVLAVIDENVGVRRSVEDTGLIGFADAQ